MNTHKMFKVSYVCIEDIIQAIEDDYCGKDKLEKVILMKIARRLGEGDMKWIASKLSDAFCNCCFWENLADRFKQIVNEKN